MTVPMALTIGWCLLAIEVLALLWLIGRHNR